VNRITVVFLCLMLCLAGTTVPTASAAVLSVSDKTALVLCQQQEYLMRDTYQNIFAKYPALTTFGTVAVDENSMIGTLSKLFAKYKIAVPADSKVAAARTMASTVTSALNADAVAINLEQSTANLMTKLLRTTRNTDVARAETLIRRMSLGSHTRAFAAEQATVATHPQTIPRRTRPFPAPVTTHTVTVPASIDAAGSSDVSTALINFIRSVPDGSLINFPSAAIYRIDRAITLENRHNLIIDGHGCTLKYTAVTGTTEGYSLWDDLGGNSDIYVRNFVLIGSSPYPGVYTPGTSPTGGEWQHGFEIRSSRFEVSGCTISKVWGNGFELSTGASDVWIHDNHVISAGRQGVSVCSGTNVLVEHNAFDISGLSTFDIEPFLDSQSAINIIFRNNTAGTFGHRFFTIWVGLSGPTIDGVVVDGNTVTGASLSTNVANNTETRMTRITFTNNTGKETIAGWAVLYFTYVDGLTVTGNVQPLTSVLTNISDCTGVR
jgi:hypothetical protein